MVANQEAGMATGCTYKHTKACGPCSAGFEVSPGSASVTDRDG